MKAIIQKHYGGIDQLKMVDLPIPSYKDNQILVKIYATNISSGDMKVNTLGVPLVLRVLMRLVFGFRGPRHQVRGISACGEVVEVGCKVRRYHKGDLIYFINSMKAGCLAEYIVLNEAGVIAKKPKIMSPLEACPLAFGALTSYHFINARTINQGARVLIYGASGSVGSYALQLAKYYGAHVTGVSSQKNHEVLKNLGADVCIDYQKVDFRALDQTYDVIFDAVMKLNKKSCKNVLKPGGRYLSVKSPTKESVDRLLAINKIIGEGKLKTLLEPPYDFTDFKQAHERVYRGHKVGNVVINIGVDRVL